MVHESERRKTWREKLRDIQKREREGEGEEEEIAILDDSKSLENVARESKETRGQDTSDIVRRLSGRLSGERKTTLDQLGESRERERDLVDEFVNELGHLVNLVTDLGAEGGELLLELLEVRLDEGRLEDALVRRLAVRLDRRGRVVVEREEVGRSSTEVLSAARVMCVNFRDGKQRKKRKRGDLRRGGHPCWQS